MSDNNQENVNSTNDEQHAEEEIVLPVEGEEEETDDVEVLKERLKQRNEAAAQLFARAKKAEGFELKDGKWVKKAQKAPEMKPNAPARQKNEEDIDARIAKGVMSVLEQRELESLDLSDELKTQVSSLAKLQGISIKKASESDYIQFLKEKEDRKKNGENGSMPTGRKGSLGESEKMTELRTNTESDRQEALKAIQKRKEEVRKKLS